MSFFFRVFEKRISHVKPDWGLSREESEQQNSIRTRVTHNFHHLMDHFTDYGKDKKTSQRIYLSSPYAPISYAQLKDLIETCECCNFEVEIWKDDNRSAGDKITIEWIKKDKK